MLASQALFQHVGDGAAGVGSLPLAIHLLAGAGFVAGLVLWLAGGRVIQPAFVILGSLIGAGVGAVLMPAVVTEPVMGLPPVYLGLACGVVCGLILSLLLFKVALASSAGLVFAAAGILAGTIVLSRDPDALPGTPTTAESAVEAVKERARDIKGQFADVTRAEAAGRVQSFADETREEAKSWWQALPDRSRKVLLMCAAGGFLLGMLIGLAAPTTSSELITSLAGGGAVMGCGWWLLNAMNPSLAERIAMGPVGVAATWLAVAAVGFGVQWQCEPAKVTRVKPAPQE